VGSVVKLEKRFDHDVSITPDHRRGEQQVVVVMTATAIVALAITVMAMTAVARAAVRRRQR